MASGSTIAAGIGAAALIGLAGYFIVTKVMPGGKFLLQTSAGPGGTINPNSPSGVYEPAGTIVTVTITAATGYTIGQVLEDGSPINTSTTQTTSIYNITMNMNHAIVVVFYKGGIPPVGTANQILPPNSTIIIGNYGCTVTLAGLDAISLTRIQSCDQNWTVNKWVKYPLTFKVIDTNGLGVPNVYVTMYPDLWPDYSKYQGYLTLDDQMITKNTPLIKKTDTNGNVTVNASYFYGLNDNLLTLSKDAGLYVNGILAVVPLSWNPYDGWNGTVNGVPIFYTGKGGDKTIPPNQTLNNIIAYVSDQNGNPTAIPQTKALVYCQFHAKML